MKHQDTRQVDSKKTVDDVLETQYLFTETELHELIERLIPFHAHLGIIVHRLERGNVSLCLEPKPEFVGDPIRPAIHGGIIASLADSTAGLAVFSVLKEPCSTSTIDLRVDYLRPGNVTEMIYADARVIRSGSRVCVTQIDLHHGDLTELIAVGTATFSVVPKPNLPKIFSGDSEG